MFDVLVYLYENYRRPDACPDHDQLTRKLSAVGFETDEIREALSWLDGLAEQAQSSTGEQSPTGVRVPAPEGPGRTPNLLVEAAFQAGWFEIQDEGSQIAARLASRARAASIIF